MDKILHPAKSRGTANFGWLNANYSFSFANYFNPDRLQFGLLRVLNDDFVAGGTGFGTHPHKDMEIITIPLKGAIKHKDSMNNSGTIKAGDVQVMSAGKGVQHSEMNANSDQELNLLQLWIFPDRQNVEPRYDQKNFEDKLKPNSFTNIVAPESDDPKEALWIHQQAYLHLGEFEEGKNAAYTIRKPGHGVYVFMIEGEAKIGEDILKKRDAIGIWNTETINFDLIQPSKILVIEVPMN
ncbi:pirin family protein [Salegentibacter chungangensis]|uniref:Pirin family protein n=1 Tax=Salegentibacter chungangensis TaxID=1335724 RepID=A0ABW3NT95_9FLAO